LLLRISTDNSPEFGFVGVGPLTFSRRRKPTDNSFIESFNDSVRD
jgi:hypothetical protein